MKKVAFRTTVLMFLLVALMVATMSGCSINRLVAGFSKSMAQFNGDNPVGVASQTTVSDESFATTEWPVIEVDADEETELEPTKTTQRTTIKPATSKPAKTKPAVTKPPVTKPPATKTPVTKPSTTKPPATPPANVVIIPLKHGVKQVETTERFYDAENGGYRNRIYVTFDRSGYSATTKELLSEVKANRNSYQAEINAILVNVNIYRKSKGVAPVTLDKELTEAAMVRACEMAWSGVHSHTRPNGTKYSTVFDDLGIARKASGENIAMGYPTAQDVSKVWKDSPTHYKNMINGNYSKIGIGVAVDQRGCYYWCQLFMA